MNDDNDRFAAALRQQLIYTWADLADMLDPDEAGSDPTCWPYKGRVLWARIAELTELVGPASPDLVPCAVRSLLDRVNVALDALSANDLLSNPDGYVWAATFCNLFPGSDFGLMLTWFANAIETGRSTAAGDLARRDAEIAELKDQLKM